MDSMTVFTIIVGIIAILGFFRIDAIVINNVVRQHWPMILKAINVINSIVWLLLLVTIIIIESNNPTWLPIYTLLNWVIFYSLIMSTLNTLEQLKIKQHYMKRASDICMVLGTILLITISWIVYWPTNFTFPNELVWVAVMTLIFVLFFTGFGAYKWLKSRW